MVIFLIDRDGNKETEYSYHDRPTYWNGYSQRSYEAGADRGMQYGSYNPGGSGSNSGGRRQFDGFNDETKESIPEGGATYGQIRYGYRHIEEH